MSESQAILLRLQRQNARTQGLLTPNLKQTSGSELFAGRKFRVAARQMRVLTADRPGFANREHINRLSAEVAHRFRNPEQGLHINPKVIEGSKSWGGVERVFHGAIQTKRETPAMPGELRQGSIIPRMETFPTPGQSIDDFRQQIQSAPRPSHTDDAPKKVVIAPKSRLFTKVEEISRSPSKPPSASVDEPDSPSLSLRSPPTIPSQSVQRQSEPGELPAPPILEKEPELSENPKSISVSKDEQVSFPAFEPGKQDIPLTDPTLGQPSAPAIVLRKAEPVLRVQPKRNAADVSLPPANPVLRVQPKQNAPDVSLPPANPVSPVIPGLPQHDQVSKQPNAATEFKQANSVGEVATPQKAIESDESTSPVQLSSQLQRSPTANEQESFRHSETPGKLLSESKEPVSEKPILQAKPVQRQLSKPLQAKLLQAKPSKSILPISPNTDALSEPASTHSVQRALSKDEDGVKNDAFTAPELPGENSLESPATEFAETPAPVKPSFSEIPGKLLPESKEPVSKRPILQAKPVQRQLSKPLQAKPVQAKPSETGKSIQPTLPTQAKLPESPLASDRILPIPSESVQRVVSPTDSPEKSSPIQRAETKNLPASPVTEPSLDKPEVLTNDSRLAGKMPLVEKIQAHSRVENLLRAIDVEQPPLKSIRPIMLQRQPSPLVQPAKYHSASMSKVLSDTLMPSRLPQPETRLPQLAASGATVSVSPNQMPLARMAEKSASSSMQLSDASPLPKSVEQPVMTGGRSEGVLPAAVQRTIDDSVTQEQPIDSPQGNTKPVDLNALAEEIFPIVKRLLSIEADRSGGSFR